MSFQELPEINEIQIAYIGGGSRNWAWVFMRDLALEGQLSGTVRLYDIDAAAALSNERIGNRLSSRDAPGKWRYETKETLKDALTGADFVVISILPGTFDEMEADIGLPESCGILQSVGDTVGPGGILRAVRTVPMYVEIAEAIKAYSPEAWVINYTNPMSVCTSTLYKVFPEIKAFGCCHEVFHTQELMARLLETECGIMGVKREEIHLNVLGINHFTWFDKISYRQKDLLPLYAAAAEKYEESGYAASEEHNDPENTFRNKNKVGFDLFRRYRMVPVAGDRHISEFLPPWYLKDRQTVARYGFALTPVSWRKEEQKRLIDQAKRYADGEEEMVLEPSGEEGIRQIKALLGLGDFVTNVNLPNRGQIQGLPMGAVVETNVLLSRDSAQPVISGRLPDRVNLLVRRHAEGQESLVKAGLTKNTGLAFSVFLNDPLTAIPICQAETLFLKMMKATSSYLEGWDMNLYG